MRQWIAFSLLLISSLILSLPVSAAVSSCDAPIKFGALTWESGQFTTGVLKYITENGYGCQVTEVPGAGPALENALLQDDIQVIGEQWIGRSPILEQAIEDKKVAIIGDTLEGGATQGWYVPKYVLEENPGLRRYQDLPKYAELFKDPEDPSKSRFMNCPSGWACEIFNTRLLKNTGLDKTFNSVHPGTGAALFATIIYALPPLIRLTTLGITQVNHEMVEAGRSFGSTHLQLLIWIKLPQALPSIMAGVNQAVMMSLSMVVLASMIGAPGLGEDVLQSIQTLNIGQGLQAGTAIVIVAIIIDRITQAFGQGKRARQKTIDAGRRPIG